MRVRNFLATTACLLATAPVRGESVTDDVIVGTGVNMTFKAAVPAVRDKLMRKLCPNDKRVIDRKGDPSESSGEFLMCPTVSPPPSIARTALFFLPKSLVAPKYQEQATAWANIKSSDKNPNEVRVSIGVFLYRDKKRIHDPKDHFFKPSDWAETVWRALDPS